METILFRPRLIQRLNPPQEAGPGGLTASEVFSFGGGLKNGGLGDEAMALLKPHFSFDYMGAAEFEFGDLPKSLSGLLEQAKKKEAVARILEINVTPAKEPDPEKQGYQPRASSRKKPVKAKVYVIAASEEHLETIRTFIESQTITDDYGWPKSKDFPTKEMTMIWNALALPESEKGYRNTIGGIDIQYSWMWLKRRETFEAMCEIFDLEAPPEE